MLLTRLYYLLKPGVPWRVRMALRRLQARRLQGQVAGSWPISEGAGRPPDAWPGWPDGKQLAFVLTHDVDTRRGLAKCRELAELEMRLGFRSSFNLVPEGEYVTPESLRDFLSGEGFEVGVHDLRHDGTLYSQRKRRADNARSINRYLREWQAVGFRSGFMLHDLDWIRQLDILYDASTFDTDPFEPQPDGVNTIFPFSVARNAGPAYIELPYTLPQDSTLFLVLQQTSIDVWKRKLDWIAEQGGMALLNVHPDYISFNGRMRASEYPARFYEEFLAYVAHRFGDRCWFALPREVAAYAARVLPHAPGARREIPASTDSAAPPEPIDPSVWRLRGKRVAVVLFSYYPADPRPRRAAEALVNAGMKVDVICVRDSEQEPRREHTKGIDVLRIWFRSRRGSRLAYVCRYGAFLVASFAILAARSLTRPYDLVHVHNMPDILVFSSLVPKLFGAKVILDLHDPMPELMMTMFNLRRETFIVRLLERLERWSVGMADAVFTVNVACQRLFASRCRRPDKISVIMNSPDDAIFRFRPNAAAAVGPPPDRRPFVIMYHGSLVERNGVNLAIDALAKIRPSIPAAQLRIYGPETPLLGRVMQQVREMGLEEAVVYLGPKRLEEIAGAIEECDVGVIPNHRNTFTEICTPTRIFEYLALGKPVIAPRAAGVEDYFDDSALVFFEPGDAADLARQLKYVYFHRQETSRTVTCGQRVYLAHTWNRERQRFLNAAAQLLDAGVVGDACDSAVT